MSPSWPTGREREALTPGRIGRGLLPAGCCVRWTLFIAVLLVVVLARTAGAQPLPITVDADTIMYDSVQQVVTAQGRVRMLFKRYTLYADAARYDLRTQIVVATGRVRVIDTLGRELRGRTLTYNNRTEEGVLERTEGIVDRERRVYLRGTRLDFSPDRFISHESSVTSCDPRRPLVHITAKRIEIVPEEEIVAYDASVYFRGRRVYTARQFVMSLRPDEPAILVPGFGYNDIDGYWVDNKTRIRTPAVRGTFHLKYGTASGIMGLLALTHKEPSFSTMLRVGRTQTVDDRRFFNLLQYDVAEVRAEGKPVPIGSTPLSWTLAGGAGWFSERLTAQQLVDLGHPANVATSRLDGQVTLQTSRIPLAPKLTYGIQTGIRISSYGTGDVRTSTSYGADLVYQMDSFTTVTLGYTRLIISGATPLVLDVVDPEDTVFLSLVRAVPDRYTVSARVAHNSALAETKLNGALALIVSPSLEFSASAVYNTRLSAFEDIDYALRVICDCVDVSVRYRQVRREIALEFGLLGFGQRQVPIAPRSTPQFTFPSDER